MAKNNKDKNNNHQPAPEKKENYAYGLYSIGAFIKKLLNDKGISHPEFARRMGLDPRNIDKFFKHRFIPIPVMLRVSELLDHDLIAEYRPNVKPKPDSPGEVAKRLQSHVDDLEQQLKEKNDKIERYSNEIRRLEAKIEVLKELELERKR